MLGAVSISFFSLASVAAHELAHSKVALRNGIPVKGITLFVFGGVARIAREATSPWVEFKIAIAGPLCSLSLAVILAAISTAGFNGFEQPVTSPIIWLVVMNLGLALFNLLPGFPLDGGRVLRAILWWIIKDYRRATHIASLWGQGIALTLILGGMALMLTRYVHPVEGLWISFIGLFLENAASTSYRQAKTYHALQEIVASDAMIPDYPRCPPPTLSVRELVQTYVPPTGYSYFPVTQEGELSGVVTFSRIKALPQQCWGVVPLAQVMSEADPTTIIHPEESGLDAMERMEEHDIDQLLVVRDRTVVGTVTRDSLLRAACVWSARGRTLRG